MNIQNKQVAQKLNFSVNRHFSYLHAEMNDRNFKAQSYILYIIFFAFNKSTRVPNVKAFIKIPGQKTWRNFWRDEPLSFCTDFEIQSFPTDLILLGLYLKNTLSYIIQFFHDIFQQLKFKQFK